MISIIIPSRSNSTTLQESLQSIFNQKDINLSEHIDLIVVINGSHEPDFSEENVEVLFGHFIYKLIRTNKVGVSNARNLGLNAATGESVIFLDDDDLLADSTLHTILISLHNDSILFMDVKSFSNEKINISNFDTLSEVSLMFNENQFISPIHGRRLFQNVTAKVFPCYILKESNIRFLETINVGEDVCFMYSLLFRIKSFRKLGGSAIYFRRISDNSTTGRKTTFIHEFNLYNKLLFNIFKIFIKRVDCIYIYFFLYLVAASLKYHFRRLLNS
jgi:glycosyltransferase involved in cell wall biosynthesis